MLGVGGVLAEAVDDVVFRPAPLDRATAEEMIDDLRTAVLLGSVPRRVSGRPRRPGVTSSSPSATVITEREDVASVDVNPLKIATDGRPDRRRRPRRAAVRPSRSCRHAGAGRHRPPSSSPPCSSHAVSSSPGRRRTPASSDSCRCTTCLASGYAGAVYGTNLHGEVVLGVQTVADVAEIPDGAADLVFVCTPPAANAALLDGVRGARGSRPRS